MGYELVGNELVKIGNELVKMGYELVKVRVDMYPFKIFTPPHSNTLRKLAPTFKVPSKPSDNMRASASSLWYKMCT